MTVHAGTAPDLYGLHRALSATVGATYVQANAGPDEAAFRVAPATTGELAATVALCRQHGVSIVPEGGRTGLVGGCQSRPDQVLLSLRRMAAIEAIYPAERVAVVQAGVTLETLQAAALAHGLEPGIDLAARGSATIGGMVSTNAGGIMAHRYGVMRHRVLGIEAVLPDGSIYSDLTRVVKNTAGYDLKHLFIGAEGTLGIVTRVALKLEPVPAATATVLLGLPSADACLAAIDLALRTGKGHLRAAEGLWQSYIRLTATAHQWAEPGLPLDQPVYLILMLGGEDQAALDEAAAAIFETMHELYPTTTGIAATSKRQEAQLWRLREDTDQLYRTHHGAPSFDVSVPLSEIGAYVTRVTAGLAAIDGGIRPYVFGHLADGNLHIVLNRGPLDAATSVAVEDVLYAGLDQIGGAFSAEHGIGAKRTAALLATANATKLNAMRRIKQALDPELIMNPGKVLPLAPSNNKVLS